MKEIFDIIVNSLTFINTYYNNFIFNNIDEIDVKIDKSIMFLIYIFWTPVGSLSPFIKYII